MPFRYRYTAILEGPGHGASESWYFERATNSVQDALNFCSEYKDQRAKLLGTEWDFKGERVELVLLDDGITKVKRQSRLSKVRIPGNQSRPACESNISLQAHAVTADSKNSKLIFLAGVYAGIFPGGDKYVPAGIGAGDFATRFNSWASTVIGLGFGWQTKPVSQRVGITNYVFNAATGITHYTLDAAVTWPTTNKPVQVSVEFPLSRSPLDGVQLVIPDGPLGCYTATPRPAAPWTVKGELRLTTTAFVSLGTASPTASKGTINAENPVSRKRGRPLLVSRGRVAVRNRY